MKSKQKEPRENSQSAENAKIRGARLYCILAREKRTAVIFRRGPSKWVQLIQWNTDNDTFAFGQWFNGRIYERRCDLDPKGDRLIYFAAKFKETKFTKHYSWTAISKPPWLTALALWPKGDCWHGGGVFDDDKNIWLNHPSHQATMEGNLPRTVTVRLNPQPHGEDGPVLGRRLLRDGWKLVQDGDFDYQGLEGGWVAKAPEIWHKLEPRKRFTLEMQTLGISSDKGGEWYVQVFNVTDKNGEKNYQIGRASWADWDQRNHLVFAQAGKLYRWDLRKQSRPEEIADFNNQKPEAIMAPPEAKQWQK